jgi:hypothetical protein
MKTNGLISPVNFQFSKITNDKKISDNMELGGQPGEKMVMQVNKYIPHYQRLPTKLEKKDFKLFQEDYMESNHSMY